MKTSDNIQEIAKALSIAQGEIKPASKDGANPHFKSKFSTLSSIWESIRSPLSAQGLTVLQDITTEEKTVVCVSTRIIHTSGQWIEFGPMCIPINKNDAQGMGSAASYGKRYALCAALGIVSSDDDDDGELAVGRGKCAKNEAQKEPMKSYVECVSPKKISAQQHLVLSGLSAQISEEFKAGINKWIKEQYNTTDLVNLPETGYESVSIKFNNCLKYQEDLRKNENN